MGEAQMGGQREASPKLVTGPPCHWPIHKFTKTACERRPKRRVVCP